MLRGFFDDAAGRPTLRGRLLVPRLNFLGDIYFLVDTGADTTLLAPDDGKRFGADYSRLSGAVSSQGTAGMTRSFVEPARVAFADAEGVVAYAYDIGLHILELDPGLATLPSLVGRDVLDRWRMVYDSVGGELSFEVHSADDSLQVSQ